MPDVCMLIAKKYDIRKKCSLLIVGKNNEKAIYLY